MKFDFVGRSRIWLIVALVVVAVGLVSLLVQGMNFGIDFTGGVRLMLHLPGGFDDAQVRDVLTQVEATDDSGRTVNLGNSYIQRIVGEDDAVVIRTMPLTEEEQQSLLAAIATEWNEFSMEDDILEQGNVGPTMGGELLRNAILALLLANLALVAYVSYRFQFKFAVSALVALAFDAFVVIAAYSILQIELNGPFVAAVLTVIGYSINATIVIFDRIRENLRYSGGEKNLINTVNLSINQILVRSIVTSITTLLVLGSLLAFGGETITPFALPIFIGIFSGTFSSVFISGPLWYTWKSRERRARA